MQLRRLKHVKFIGQVSRLKTQAGFECYDLEAEDLSSFSLLEPLTDWVIRLPHY